MKLLFRASEHNFCSKAFHKECDNKGLTLIIIQNEYDYIFGGYVSESWISDPIKVFDPTAFLFTIKPKMKYIPFRKCG